MYTIYHIPSMRSISINPPTLQLMYARYQRSLIHYRKSSNCKQIAIDRSHNLMQHITSQRTYDHTYLLSLLHNSGILIFRQKDTRGCSIDKLHLRTAA